MSTPDPGPVAGAATAAPPTGADPLASLHHMSATAGLASGQYAEVNSLAVVAALLGVTCYAAALSPVLLFVPVAGIVVALVAARQVRHSNGTQAGKWAAYFGLASCALCAAGVVGWMTRDHLRSVRAAGQMAAVLDQLTQEIKAGRYDSAYSAFSPVFQDRVPPADFAAAWKRAQNSQYAGNIASIRWNNVPPAFETVEGGTSAIAFLTSIVTFEKGGERFEDRFQIIFRQVGDGWKIERFDVFFPEEKRKGAGK